MHPPIVHSRHRTASLHLLLHANQLTIMVSFTASNPLHARNTIVPLLALTIAMTSLPHIVARLCGYASMSYLYE
ncbi:hypothetical protein L195_g053771, partial [Trifolium pratense]